MAVDDHGDGGVVVFQAGEVFSPEFPAALSLEMLVLRVSYRERLFLGTNEPSSHVAAF